ncbi:NAD(P)H oxidase regulator [Favolaschia claudopus]|uniref:NAD(P)H oxidase regulator n=1 Tax=Favolaschia claudopus TaxID=2862362 RepID=A0AAW0CPX5_9AGAR
MAVEQLKLEMHSWQAALKAYDAGDFNEALQLFEPIADTAKILVNTALIHSQLGNRALAHENFTRAIELDKYLAIAYFQRGVCSFYAGEYVAAAKDFSDAQIMMRTNAEINYDILGLNYKLKLREILFNKWLTLLAAGNKGEASSVLQNLREEPASSELEDLILQTEERPEQGVPFSVPVGTLYRPSAARLQLLYSAELNQSSIHSESTPVQTTRPRRRLPSLCTASSDTASIISPSIKEHRKYRTSMSSTIKPSPISDDSPVVGAIFSAPKRAELNRVVGNDMTAPLNDIDSIPCAGARISHGHLLGLMAWRFVVRLDGSSPGLPSVVTNFILDTGSKDTYVPAEVLVSLGRGRVEPGTEVTVRIQGIKVKCLVAESGDAGRVGISFMTAGDLTYYFDSPRTAPILYYGSERPAHVPRTIYLPRRSWLARILSLFTRSSAA